MDLALLALLVLVPLLQVPAVLYLSRFFEVEELSPPGREFRSDRAGNASPGECPRCAAPNEPEYTFCRRCVTRLRS